MRQEGDSAPKLVKQSISVPTPADNQLLVRVAHVAQNPTDGMFRPVNEICEPASLTFAVQSFDSNAFGDGAVLGCDFVGTVEATGPGAKRIAVGTTIAGLIWGGKLAPHGPSDSGKLMPDDRGDQGPRGVQQVYPRRRAHLLPRPRGHHTRAGVHHPPRSRHRLARTLLKGLPEYAAGVQADSPHLGRQL